MERDNRRYVRKEKAVSVHFVSADSTKAMKGTGVTQNLSRGGMYFRPRHWKKNSRIEEGQKLRFRVDGRRCDGRVLRVDYTGGSTNAETPGVAVRFHGSPDCDPLKNAV